VSGTFLPHSLSEDAAQTAARISVDRFKDVRFAVSSPTFCKAGCKPV
jgi:hypothetical protein